MRTKLPKRVTILQTWEPVFKHFWNSEYPGIKIEVVQVFRQGDVYAVLQRPSAKAEGPYTSLSEAVRVQSLLQVTSSTIEVVCPRVEAKQLAKLLKCGDEDDVLVGFRLKINGEYFVLTPARYFGRCKNQDAVDRTAAKSPLDC